MMENKDFNSNLILTNNFVSEIELDFEKLKKIILMIQYLYEKQNKEENNTDIFDENDYEKKQAIFDYMIKYKKIIIIIN